MEYRRGGEVRWRDRFRCEGASDGLEVHGTLSISSSQSSLSEVVVSCVVSSEELTVMGSGGWCLCCFLSSTHRGFPMTPSINSRAILEKSIVLSCDSTTRNRAK